MRKHAFRTAVTLYHDGTLDLETAARQAGVPEERLERTVERLGGEETTVQPARERIVVGASD